MARQNHCGRRAAFSLVELLIVVGIMILMAAIALPQLKNTLQDNKLREGSRIVSAFFAQARARAASTGRPCGVYFDVEKVVGVNPSNYGRQCTRMSLCEIPANYTGDFVGGRVAFKPQDPMDSSSQPIEVDAGSFASDVDIPRRLIYVGDPANGITRKWYELNFNLNFGMFIIMDQRGALNNNSLEPFLIKFCNGPGSRLSLAFQGLRYQDKFYLVWSQDSLLQVQNAFLPKASLREAEGYKGSCFVIIRQPRKVGVTRELPQGVAIDMCYSGMGVVVPPSGTDSWQNPYFPPDVPPLCHGMEFGVGLSGSNWVDSGCNNIVMMFNPNGGIGSVYLNSLEVAPSSGLYFLVGRAERVGITLFDYNTDDERKTSNIFDPLSLWVTVGRVNGTISTSDNLPPPFSGPGMVGVPSQRTNFLRQSRLAAQQFSLTRGQ